MGGCSRSSKGIQDYGIFVCCLFEAKLNQLSWLRCVKITPPKYLFDLKRAGLR